MKIFLDESQCKDKLAPFTLTRHTADMRIGILTIREKWELLLIKQNSTLITDNDLNALIIKSNIIPNKDNYNDILASAGNQVNSENNADFKSIEFPWNIFQLNDWALRQDFELLTHGRKSEPISDTNRVVGKEYIFIEPGAIVEHSMLNASTGPIYIGKDAIVMEGNMIRGPFALCEGSVLKMGSKIYGATTIGPFSVAGGEIKNSVIFGFSNKAHDGYLGDSVIGEWCNLGAGTSNSNVKNTASEVKYINNQHAAGIIAGNKGGLLMGDYSRAAINTSFNTGTIVGVCCNIFGQNIPEKYVPNFSWGNERYIFEKALSDIINWKKMKGKDISEMEKNLLHQLYIANN